MYVNSPDQIIKKLEKELDEINQSKEDSVIIIKKAIGICSLALTDLRKFIIDNKFKNKQEEIHFFKQVKPTYSFK